MTAEAAAGTTDPAVRRVEACYRDALRALSPPCGAEGCVLRIGRVAGKPWMMLVGHLHDGAWGRVEWVTLAPPEARAADAPATTMAMKRRLPELAAHHGSTP